MQEKKAILLLSGGIDSTTALYYLVKKGYHVHCLIFDYGQTLIKEVDIARENAKRLKQSFSIIKIDLGFARSKCSLISKNPIATNRSFEEIDSDVPTSYVQFRNGIFLSYAVFLAEVQNTNLIYGGFNGLDSGQYMDDTLAFVKSFQQAANAGTSPKFEVKIQAPFAMVSKSDIVKLGRELGIDYAAHTWSCYKNGEQHCGQCDSCLQRNRALNFNN
jgi:7-cyano-7-deazaguanine synthase